MIISFADKDTELIYNEQKPKKLKLPEPLLIKALDKLMLIHAAHTVYDFYDPPSNRFEALKGDRKGYFSVRINNRWRICFGFDNGKAYDVEIIDYH